MFHTFTEQGICTQLSALRSDVISEAGLNAMNKCMPNIKYLRSLSENEA